MRKPKTKTVLVRQVDSTAWAELRAYAGSVGRYLYSCLNEAIREYLARRKPK